MFHSVWPPCPPFIFFLHFQQRPSGRNSVFGSGTFHILGFSSTINGKFAHNTVTQGQADVSKTNWSSCERSKTGRGTTLLCFQRNVLSLKIMWSSQSCTFLLFNISLIIMKNLIKSKECLISFLAKLHSVWCKIFDIILCFNTCHQLWFSYLYIQASVPRISSKLSP